MRSQARLRLHSRGQVLIAPEGRATPWYPETWPTLVWRETQARMASMNDSRRLASAE